MKNLSWAPGMAAILAAGLALAGCGAPQAQPTATPAAAKPAATAAAPAAQPTPTAAPAAKATAPAAQPTATQAPKPAAKEETLADLIGKGKKLEGYSVESVMTAKSVTVSSKIFIQGKKARIERAGGPQNVVVIMDGETNTMISYFPDQNRAMKMPVPSLGQAAGGDNPSTPGDYLGSMDPSKADVVETTTLDGVRVRVLLFKGPDGKEAMRMWVREDYGMPVKVETATQDGSKSTIEYKNLKVGQQPADLFQVPAGVQVTDASQIAIPTPRPR